MWTMTRIRPAVCWWFFSCLLGLALCMRAAQADGTAVGLAGMSKPLLLSAWERDWIAHNRQVIVASVQYPLYLFKDEQGRWSGLNNDILLQLSRMTGLQFVHEESFSTEHLLGLLESARANMSTTLAMNEERKAYLDFSHAFGGSGWVFVERAGAQPVESLEALQGKVLALPARHALESAIRHEHPQIGLRSVKTYAEARALVETGEAEGFVMDDVLLYGLAAGRPDPDRLKVVGKFLTIEPLAIMFSRSDAEFKKLVDDEMKRLIQTREAHVVYERWFQKPIPPANRSLNLPMNYLLKDFWKYPTDQVPG